jgi:hypothetical protein
MPSAPLRWRTGFFFPVCLFLFVLLCIFLSSPARIQHNLEDVAYELSLPVPSSVSHRPRYKDKDKDVRNETVHIVDNFPLAVSARSPKDIPPVPSYNRPPDPHVPEYTPLLIGFTRNWPMLQQTIVSYIAAGWPAQDIYVVENTGTMNANAEKRLSLQNPFYLDTDRLRNVFGVNVISTPTYLNFAQLQNFYLYTAIQRNWTYYFWGHMDVVAVSDEAYIDPKIGPYMSLYERTVQDLRDTLNPDYAVDERGRPGRWAIKFYAYDRLALVNRLAYEEVGGFDPHIAYYGSDCDMHERLTMAGFKQEAVNVGLIYDVGSTLDDLIMLYRRKDIKQSDGFGASSLAAEHENLRRLRRYKSWGAEDSRGSESFEDLKRQLDAMQARKNSQDHRKGRNTWQATQDGGWGEPYYRRSEGFDQAIMMTTKCGQRIMQEKWGHQGCDLRRVGLRLGDEWRVDHDWDWGTREE